MSGPDGEIKFAERLLFVTVKMFEPAILGRPAGVFVLAVALVGWK